MSLESVSNLKMKKCGGEELDRSDLTRSLKSASYLYYRAATSIIHKITHKKNTFNTKRQYLPLTAESMESSFKSIQGVAFGYCL